MNQQVKMKIRVLKDALKLLNSPRINVLTGNGYVVVKNKPESKDANISLNKFLRKQTCEVCAMGVVFLAYLSRHPEVKSGGYLYRDSWDDISHKSQWDNSFSSESIRDLLCNIFSHDELHEVRHMASRARSERLVAIDESELVLHVLCQVLVEVVLPRAQSDGWLRVRRHVQIVRSAARATAGPKVPRLPTRRRG